MILNRSRGGEEEMGNEMILSRQCITQLAIRVLAFVVLVGGCGLSALAGSQAPAKSRSDQTGTNDTSQRSVVLDATVTILQRPDQPQPVQQAAEDLATDSPNSDGKAAEDRQPCGRCWSGYDIGPRASATSRSDPPHQFDCGRVILNFRAHGELGQAASN